MILETPLITIGTLGLSWSLFTNIDPEAGVACINTYGTASPLASPKGYPVAYAFGANIHWGPKARFRSRYVL